MHAVELAADGSGIGCQPISDWLAAFCGGWAHLKRLVAGGTQLRSNCLMDQQALAQLFVKFLRQVCCGKLMCAGGKCCTSAFEIRDRPLPPASVLVYCVYHHAIQSIGVPARLVASTKLEMHDGVHCCLLSGHLCCAAQLPKPCFFQKLKFS